jgi:hypothetical protein
VLAGCGRLAFDAVDDGSVTGTADAARATDGGAVGSIVFAENFGGAGNEEGYALAIGAGGDVYMTGTLTAGFMLGEDALTAAGGEDLLIAAFDPSVGKPKWARSFGSALDDRGQGIAVDSQGQLYVVGLFTGAIDFGGQMKVPAGMWDVFVASYTSQGTLRWVNTAGGAGADFAYDVAVDASDNVIVTGYYEGAVNFGDGALPVFGMRDVFVAKYSASGVLQWSRGYGSAGFDSGQAIAAGPTGNVVAGGALGGAADFGGGSIGAANASFVVELTATGAYAWARAIAGTATWDIDVDPRDGRMLIGSRVLAGADLGMGPLPAPPGGADGLVVAIDADHQQAWYRAFGGTLSDIGLGTAVDGAGNVYSIGLGGPDIDFGGGVVTGNGDQDIYLAAHDANGALRWGKLFGGTIQDRGYAVACAPDGSVYISGRYANTVDFGTGPRPSAGGNDLFLVKLQ